MTLAEHDPRPDPTPEAQRPWDDQGIGYVYTERAHLTALLAAHYPSVLVTGADPHAPDWPILYVRLPTGQCSWYVSPSDLPIFAHVQKVTAPDGPVWDGHTNDQKYARIAEWAKAIAASSDMQRAARNIINADDATRES